MIYAEATSKAGARRKPIEYKVTETGCWEVTSHTTGTCGYPQLVRDDKNLRMSRYVYECEHGSIPQGLVVMHKCDNTLCINPDHLKAGTRQENTNDMMMKKRQSHGVRHNFRLVKLTEAQAIEILHDKRSGYVIAAEYNIHPTTVYEIKRRETWKHIQ